MDGHIHYLLILCGALVAMASPGPATLAISTTAMNQGRKQGLVLASGILTGSIFWSCAAAFGLGALLYANVWLFETLRYMGALYLLWLAYKSLRSAAQKDVMLTPYRAEVASRSLYFKGLALHLTNPKAILFLGALYSLGMPSTVTTQGLISVIVMLAIQSACVNFGYAFLFSNPKVRRGYFKMKRLFDGLFGVLFGIASIKILFSRLAS